jgi:PAS domain S-box-containing protein
VVEQNEGKLDELPLLKLSVQYRIVDIMSRFLWIATILTLIVVAFYYQRDRLVIEGVLLGVLAAWFWVGRSFLFERVKNFQHLDIFASGLVLPAFGIVCLSIFFSPDDFCRSAILLIVALAGIAYHRHAVFCVAVLIVLGLYAWCRVLADKPLNNVDIPLFFIHIPLLALTFRWLVGGINQLAKLQLKSVTDSLAQTVAAKNELLETHKHLEKILERAPLILCVIDTNGVYVQSRGSGLACLGYAPDELIGESIFEVFKDYPAFIDAVNSALKGLPGRGRQTVREDLVLEICYDALRNPEGEIIGVVGVAMDITPSVMAEQKNRQLEHQLAHSQKLESLGVLAGGVAHDFNNYLMAIVAFAESLGSKEDPETAKTIEQIQQVSMQAAGVCQQMLDFAGDDQALVALEKIELSELMQNMEGFLRAVVPKSITFEMELELQDHVEQNWKVELNHLKIQQVIVNVLKNACDAVEGKPNPRIFVGVSQYEPKDFSIDKSRRFGIYLSDETYVQVVVQDNGYGIEASNIEKLFDLYFTTKETGHGFGMAVVARVMEDHRAFVQIETEAGVGSTIRLAFPAVIEPNGSPVVEVFTHPHFQPDKYNVMIVDDESTVLTAIKRLLEANGHQVFAAQTAAAAISAAGEYGDKIDCFVLDYSMPKCTGLELLHQLRENGYCQPAVLCSGHVLEAKERRDVQYWPEAFLSKPFRYRELFSTIEELCLARTNGKTPTTKPKFNS